jgi:spore maturation protein A
MVTLLSGRGEAIMGTLTDSAAAAVTVCLTLAGAYVLWLGLMGIAERSGLTAALAKKLRPVLRLLFPGVPDGHPAQAMISMNLSANILGMGNAATPFGLAAMKEMERLNDEKGRASDAECMLLIVNASSIQLIPTTVISLRAAAGAANPADIMPATVAATFVTTLVAIAFGKLLEKFS